MTRAQATDFLKTLGIAEPTEEQITAYLNNVGSETKKERELAEKYKSDAVRVTELQSKLDELSNQNLSDIEKANKATESANARVADLEKQIAEIRTKEKLAELGIIGEPAEKLIVDGNLDFSVLGQILSDRETMAVSKREKELLAGMPNPSGGNTGDGSAGEKTGAEKIAEEVSRSFAGSAKESADVIAKYI